MRIQHVSASALLFVQAFFICAPMAILGVAVFNAAAAALTLASDSSAPVPPVIGQLIRLLLLAQTAFCAAVGSGPGSLAAALLILAWPISRAVSRRFYAS